MTLWLRKRPDYPGENYVVTCGECTVGVISKEARHTPHFWSWSITAIYMHPLTHGPTGGSAPTRELAMAAFAERFRLWLRYAGLREFEEGEMQIGEDRTTT